MKKLFICFAVMITYSLGVNAQADIQMSILTECGIITVSKTIDQKDKVIVAVSYWDKIAGGTKFSSANLPFFKSKKLCIEIADREKGNCARGIGFGCSMYDCPLLNDGLVNRVDAENRACAVRIRKIKGAIEIIFLDNVNWKSLEEN